MHANLGVHTTAFHLYLCLCLATAGTSQRTWTFNRIVPVIVRPRSSVEFVGWRRVVVMCHVRNRLFQVLDETNPLVSTR
jgi:hypothetical protein